MMAFLISELLGVSKYFCVSTLFLLLVFEKITFDSWPKALILASDSQIVLKEE
jgi:hypothetical protein